MRTRTVAAAAATVVGAAAAWTAFCLVGAARAGEDAKAHLLAAEVAVDTQNLPRARTALTAAGADFRTTSARMRRLGPLLPALEVVPLVRGQLRGVKAFAAAGTDLSTAGLAIVDAADALASPADPDRPLAEALTDLEEVERALDDGVTALDDAAERIGALDRVRLLGPLGEARIGLLTRLPRVQARARSAHAGIVALRDFTGGAGTRRYLLLSQNPDEPRPTGGFIGSYGVLAADGGHVRLERYDAIEAWVQANPAAVVAPADAPTALRLPDPPVPQRLANVNATPDWPATARLALDLWARAGEEPAHGAVGFTPEALARLLAVTGPLSVPGYDPTPVSADNVIARLDAETHGPDAPTDGTRKDFLGVLGELVLRRVLATPAEQWPALAEAVGAALDAHELVAWTTDDSVAATAATHRWDFTLPDLPGDFFFASEFAYVAKNGRGLRRSYDHRVELAADGSARITTTMTIVNTLPPSTAASGLNPDSQAYITLYGPAGATLGDGADPPVADEPTLAGHPAAGWLRAADPLATTSLTVVWDAPAVALATEDGELEYRLWWMTAPGRDGEELRLVVIPPEGWTWADEPPPARLDLAGDVQRAWRLRPEQAQP